MNSPQIAESLATAELIRNAIVDSGLTKIAIARELKVTAPAVQGWERTGRITPSKLRALGKLVGKNLSGEAGLITELPPAILEVVRMMEGTDDEGRLRIKFSASDVLYQYNLKTQRL